METINGKVRTYRKKDGFLIKSNENKNTNKGENKLRIVVFKDIDKRKRN